jgi:hypothetical protein
MLGAEAGTYNIPDQNCPNYFRGGLDEVRIYDRALKYGQVMDERYRCSQEPSPPQYYIAVRTPPPSFKVISGSVKLNPVDSVIRILTFDNKTVPGVWTVGMQPGSSLRVKAVDLYSKAYPDAWYVEIADERGRVDRGIAFPNTNNAPVEGAIPSGNATVLIRYFDGKERFPATVAVQFDSIAPPPEPIIPPGILSNPIIVIYSASWATLVALVLVILWLHKRKKKEDSG